MSTWGSETPQGPRTVPPRASWPGYYYDGRQAQRLAVTVTIQPDGIVLTLEDGSSRWWPFDLVQRPATFSKNDPVRLVKRGEFPETLVVPDPGFATALPQLSRKARRMLGRGIPTLPALAIIGLATLALALAAYIWGVPALASAAAEHLPVAWEERLGLAVVDHLAPRAKRCTEPRCIEAMQQLVDALSAPQPPSPYTFRVAVVDAPTLNAVAAPGGYIVVYRGLLEKMSSPEELAGVLAHEMQHVLQRHSTKALFRELGVRALLAVLTGDAQGTSRVLETASNVGALHFSRRDEEAADRAGMRMVLDARIDPSGMVHFLETLEKSDRMPERLTYLSTHPSTHDRVQHLKAIGASVQYTPVTLLSGRSWDEIRRSCRSAAAEND